ncbi:beta-lactamase family protein [Saprospiraceae bacterium]|nr:beta-lactamase family protein [Saprospiraceae bacterium]
MKCIILSISLVFSTMLCFGQLSNSNSIDSIFSEWEKEGVPGCALGVMKDGKSIYSKGYGLANLEYDIQNSANTVFRIASTSKQFTAACIVLLEEQGKLSLDDNLYQFFPEFPDYAKNISIRHLLNHTSGIRDYLTISWLKGLGDNDYYEDKDVMKWLINQRELNFDPGDQFLYSNSGYWLLGQIVNKVAGMNMADFAKKEIFDPLNMASTHFHNNHNLIVKNRASGYIPIDENSFQISMTTLEMIGDGGIYTTINDIKKWDDSFYDSSVLSKAFWNKMTQKGLLNDGEVLDYAAGLGISEYKGLEKISHGGAFVGYRAELIRFPEQHLSIAVFANRGDANPTRMAHQVADILLAEDFKNATPETANMLEEKPQNFVKLKTSELKAFSGNYWNESSSLARKIYIKNDTLRYFRSETSESLLVPISKNEFKMLHVGSDVSVKFNTDKKGSKTMSFSQNGSEPSISKEYEVKAYSKDELRDFEGDYYSKELDVNYELKLKNETLTLHINGIEISPTKVIMANLFSLEGYGIIQFSTDASGSVSDLRLAAGRVKNLLFEKQ